MKPLRWSGKEKTERTPKGAIGEFQPRQERDSGGLRLDKTKTAGSPSGPEARQALSRMAMLRNIPFFYLRNFAISVARKAIRLQFNCDGTHIVGAEDYARFVEENLES